VIGHHPLPGGPAAEAIDAAQREADDFVRDLI
jgi:hypothetical protein